MLTVTGVLVYVKQPFLDHSKKEIDYDAHYNFDYNEHVTYSAISVDARPSLLQVFFEATASYTLHNDSGQPRPFHSG